MATNTIYQKIIKWIFKGNVGKESQLSRLKREVDEFEKTGATPNATQQAHIDKVNSDYLDYENKIHSLLGTTKLEDME